MDDREELRNVLHMLRVRYGRRRLFRVADVTDAVLAVRRTMPRAPATPERFEVGAPSTPDREVKRLRWTLQDE